MAAQDDTLEDAQNLARDFTGLMGKAGVIGAAVAAYEWTEGRFNPTNVRGGILDRMIPYIGPQPEPPESLAARQIEAAQRFGLEFTAWKALKAWGETPQLIDPAHPEYGMYVPFAAFIRASGGR